MRAHRIRVRANPRRGLRTAHPYSADPTCLSSCAPRKAHRSTVDMGDAFRCRLLGGIELPRVERDEGRAGVFVPLISHLSRCPATRPKPYDTYTFLTRLAVHMRFLGGRRTFCLRLSASAI